MGKGDKHVQRVIPGYINYNDLDDDYMVVIPDLVPVIPQPIKQIVQPKKEVKGVALPKKEVPVIKKEPPKQEPIPRKELHPLTLPKKEVPVPKKEVPKKLEPPPRKEIHPLLVPKREEPPKKETPKQEPIPKKEIRGIILPKKEVPVPKKEEVPKKLEPPPRIEIHPLLVPKREEPPKKETPKQEPIPVIRKELNPLTLPKKEDLPPKKEEPKQEPIPIIRKELNPLTLPKKEDLPPKKEEPKQEPIPVIRKELRAVTLPKREEPVQKEEPPKNEEIHLRKELRPITLPKREEHIPPKEEPSKKKINPPPKKEIQSLVALLKKLDDRNKEKQNKKLHVKTVPQDISVRLGREPIRVVTFPKPPDLPCGINIGTLNYDVPTCNDLAVLLVFFDYTGSVRILMNYLFMREKLKLANIPVFTLELVVVGSKPKISDAIHVHGSSYLFQKEHLIRLLEKQIPEQFTKLACLDADVLFNDPIWYDKLSNSLNTSQIVQCFNTAFWLDITYTRIQKHASSCLTVPKGKRLYGEITDKNFHPGFAWAFTREWYNSSGFYDLAVIGSGDTMFAYGIMGYPTHITGENRIYLKSYEDWKATTNNPTYSHLDVNLYHLYHGSIAKRQYVSRYSYFEKYAKIEDCLTEKNEDGVYDLLYPELDAGMLTVFKDRDDDGLD